MCSCNILFWIIYSFIAVICYIGWLFYLGLILDERDYEIHGFMNEMSEFTFLRILGGGFCALWPLSIPSYFLYKVSAEVFKVLGMVTELGKTLKNKGKEND